MKCLKCSGSSTYLDLMTKFPVLTVDSNWRAEMEDQVVESMAMGQHMDGLSGLLDQKFANLVSRHDFEAQTGRDSKSSLYCTSYMIWRVVLVGTT